MWVYIVANPRKTLGWVACSISTWIIGASMSLSLLDNNLSSTPPQTQEHNFLNVKKMHWPPTARMTSTMEGEHHQWPLDIWLKGAWISLRGLGVITVMRKFKLLPHVTCDVHASTQCLPTWQDGMAACKAICHCLCWHDCPTHDKT